MENKIVSKFHERAKEREDFIYMIDKYKKPEQSTEDFTKFLHDVEENNLNKYSSFEQETARKMNIVFSVLLKK